ncbi:DUF4350 domain-containing protein [Cryptosporangium phraense]|uniref:DUF4350 domain-containing protein n=1 Tax=Cryptosporangium phraense TaxID=2593070 RepID=A0A545AGT6_9ACTN|nr:DUF4350 domain-containing protein [Cryptosporangium phraense]TQS40542.1 DUF4350 domain-containing protein [Cryptosporangium phraense]
MTTTATPPAVRSPWRVRIVLGTALVALVAVAIIVLNSTGPSGQKVPLDPDGAYPEGTRALAVLLGNHGHPLTEVDTTDETLTGASDGDVTIVVAYPYNLGKESLRKLADLPDTVRVVFLQPDTFTLDDLDVGVGVGTVSLTDTTEPNCGLPEARSAGNADAGGYHFTGDGLTTCYGGTLAVLDRPSKAELVFVGAADALTNEHLAEHGNAALSLGLLSAHRGVIWLQRVTPEAIAQDEPRSLTDLLPGWIPTTLWMLLAAGVLAAFWRGRRLSAPIAEPLPVVVRSTETVEGRARLYQRAKARPEAAEALRGAALARLLPVLGLGSHPELREVCDAVADRSGWPAATVGQHLYGPPPADDHGLVVLADALDALVSAVTSPTRTSVTNPDEGQQS